MNRRIGIFLLLVLAIFMVCPAATSSAEQPTAIESTYGIAHCDATELLDPERDYLIIVNSTHEYDFGGAYHVALQPDLVYLPNAVDGDIMAVEKAAFLAFTSLQYDLKVNHGIDVALYDGYRTASDQEFINSLYASGTPGITNATQPGFSEHHTGLLLDIVLWLSDDGENYKWHSANAERLATVPEFRTVYQTMVDYGFILRYPSDKADITGVKNAEFDIRFVGSAATAHAIMDNGLCLEEYLN